MQVDSSDSRRCRSVGEDLVVHEQLAANPVDSKPLAKCTAQLDENAGLSERVGPAGEKHIRQVVSSISNMKEILPIMKKDILELEKKIPWNCLVKSWKLHRANWRKGVKQSSTVLVTNPPHLLIFFLALYADADKRFICALCGFFCVRM